MKNITVVVVVGLFFVASVLCNLAQAGKRVLYVDSYHEGYEWSDDITDAIKSVMENHEITLRIFRMDSKRNTDEAFIRRAALQAKEIIDTFKPDVVITSDDNAARYLIVPYFKNAALPFVFCGINYSADSYGFPCSNVTGMLELTPVIKLIYSLKHFRRIVRVGYLARDNFTTRKEGEYTRHDVREDFIERYVQTFNEWKAEFKRLQSEVDVLIVGNTAGMKDWVETEAEQFALENTHIPTGCLLDWMTPIAFLGATRSAKEQGTYAAATALKILSGTPPATIPVVRNVQANIIINMRIAKKLGIKVPNSFFKIAKLVIE